MWAQTERGISDLNDFLGHEQLVNINLSPITAHIRRSDTPVLETLRAL